MKKKLRLVITIILFIPFTGFSQQKDTLLNKLDSLSRKKDSAGKQINNINPSSYNASTKITFKNYFVLLASDLKQEFTKPFHMTHKDWGNFGKFAVTFAGLSFVDEPVQKNSVRLMRNKPALQNISDYVTKFGAAYERYTLATFAAYGLIFKKPKMVTTTLLATQAYLTGAALEGTLKVLTGRTRPTYYPENEEAEPKFRGPFAKMGKDENGERRYASFPSGHTTIAFAAATVFAKEYKDKLYVPIIAYSAATLIGISRITENKHWTTDVLTGAVIGYMAGKNIVNNYHRYAKLKAPQQNKNTVSFNLQYFNHQFVPGVIYNLK
jgi:membrane-associated phospholipid phosphatase